MREEKNRRLGGARGFCERAPASREEFRPSEEAIVFAFKASAFTI
jgi:hypothetical protein